MSDPASKRIPLVAVPVIAVIVGIAPWTRLHRSPARPTVSEQLADDTLMPVRIARESAPTIVESNENWLEVKHETPVHERELPPHSAAPLLDLPSEPLADSLQR
ncbi:MAG: hypothetical protein KDB23_07140 [Planctomycetales bacterium]|nr:hypothetical protein [Planctomycetales bacterium]